MTEPKARTVWFRACHLSAARPNLDGTHDTF